MADYFQTVIDTGARTDEADHLARHVVSFLAEKGVIEANPSEEGGYPRGPRALEIAGRSESRPSHETIPPVYTHLQVMVGRAVHADDLSESRSPVALCPKCAKTFDDVDEEWPAAVQAWLAGDNDSALTCPECGSSAPVTAWGYAGRFGFGNLAFRFWNWPPLLEKFVEELKNELGHPVSIVRGKL